MPILNQQEADAAKEIWLAEGLTLGQLAERIGRGIYDITPWLMDWSRDPRAGKGA